MVRRRRGDGGRDPDIGGDNGPPEPSSPGAQPPPDIVFHLYGLNWDLSDPTRPPGIQVYQALTSAAQGISQNPGVLVVFATDYDPQSMPTLSFGIWRDPIPTNENAQADRKSLLLASRSPGHQKQSGEIKIRESLLSDLINSHIPNSVEESDISADRLWSMVAAVAPSGLAISVSYQAQIETAYPIVTCSTVLNFTAVAGSVLLSASPLDCGDFGIFNVKNFFQPGFFQLLETGLAVLYLMMTQNIGSGLPAPPNLAPPLPSLGAQTAQLFPREIVAESLKLDLTYLTPSIDSASHSFLFPFNWAQPMLRMPGVVLQGPTALTSTVRDEREASAVYYAATTDLVSPTLSWSLDGQPLETSTSNVMLISFEAPGVSVGHSRTFTVKVTASDGATDPPLQASATRKVQLSIVRPSRSEL
jgi:hypothetical protein